MQYKLVSTVTIEKTKPENSAVPITSDIDQSSCTTNSNNTYDQNDVNTYLSTFTKQKHWETYQFM